MHADRLLILSGEYIHRLQDVEGLLATLVSDAEARSVKLELASQAALDCDQKFDLAREGLLEAQKKIKPPRNDEIEFPRPLQQQKELLQVNLSALTSSSVDQSVPWIKMIEQRSSETVISNRSPFLFVD